MISFEIWHSVCTRLRIFWDNWFWVLNPVRIRLSYVYAIKRKKREHDQTLHISLFSITRTFTHIYWACFMILALILQIAIVKTVIVLHGQTVREKVCCFFLSSSLICVLIHRLWLDWSYNSWQMLVLIWIFLNSIALIVPWLHG